MIQTREPLDEYYDALVASESAVALPISLERRRAMEWPEAPDEP